jgi:hypothetical protein
MRGVLWVLSLLAAGCGSAVSARPAPADAASRAETASRAEVASRAAQHDAYRQPRWWLRDPQVFERAERWDIDVVLDLVDPAAVPHTRVPFRFDLRMQVYYEPDERSPNLTHAVPVEGQPAFQFEQPVCFRAARPTTRRFRVPLSVGRRDGFRPGEYELSVVRLDTGDTLGEPRSIVLY